MEDYSDFPAGKHQEVHCVALFLRQRESGRGAWSNRREKGAACASRTRAAYRIQAR